MQAFLKLAHFYEILYNKPLVQQGYKKLAGALILTKCIYKHWLDLIFDFKQGGILRYFNTV